MICTRLHNRTIELPFPLYAWLLHIGQCLSKEPAGLSAPASSTQRKRNVHSSPWGEWRWVAVRQGEATLAGFRDRSRGHCLPSPSGRNSTVTGPVSVSQSLSPQTRAVLAYSTCSVNTVECVASCMMPLQRLSVLEP